MRKLILLTAACCLAAPAAAQPSGNRGGATRTLNAEERTAVNQAVGRGRALFALDRAAAATTRDMLVRVPDPAAAGVIGWIGRPQGNAVQVTYYGREGDNYVAIYRSQLLAGRVVSPQVFQAGSRPALDPVETRMARARDAVAAKDNRACGAEAFNTIVLPPGANEEAIRVYQISPRTARTQVPLGGHFLTEVAADGTAGESVAVGAASCSNLAIPALAAGARPRPLAVTGRAGALPSELHVFLSLWTGRPLAVAAAGNPARLWGVTGEGIGELQQ